MAESKDAESFFNPTITIDEAEKTEALDAFQHRQFWGIVGSLL